MTYIDSDTACSRRKKKKKAVRFTLKAINRFLSFGSTNTPVEAFVAEITEFAIF